MKPILFLIFTLVFAITVFASVVLPPYNKSKPPSISLPVAYERAVAALGSATNEFHCISASVTTEFTSEGEWYFTFYSTNSNSMPKFIAVEFNGKVVFDNGFR
jgi:hypothetical protein